MIEKYFFPGAVYSWNPPNTTNGNPQDGAIVASPATQSTMTFKDIDSSLFDSSPGSVNRFRSHNIQKNQQVPHDWLCYITGKIATLNTNNDVLTGFMSGCYIAVWTDNTGARRVSHLGTIESVAKNASPNTDVKQTFRAVMPNTVKAYNPAEAWGYSEIATITQKVPSFGGWFKILSLVTSDNQFYSILLLKKSTSQDIICGGVKPCAGVGNTLLQGLLA